MLGWMVSIDTVKMIASDELSMPQLAKTGKEVRYPSHQVCYFGSPKGLEFYTPPMTNYNQFMKKYVSFSHLKVSDQ